VLPSHILEHVKIIAGNNYGQGSSRENAAVAPRYLGLQVVIAKSFARIHWQNLLNFGVPPLTFVDAGDYARIMPGAVLRVAGIIQSLKAGQRFRCSLTVGLDHSASRVVASSDRCPPCRGSDQPAAQTLTGRSNQFLKEYRPDYRRRTICRKEF